MGILIKMTQLPLASVVPVEMTAYISWMKKVNMLGNVRVHQQHSNKSKETGLKTAQAGSA